MTLLATCLIAAGISARDETPLGAVAAVAHRIHWRQQEEQALSLLQIHKQPQRPQDDKHLSRRQKNKLIGAQLLTHYGWSVQRQFPCLEWLWDRESGWNHKAGSRDGAYGIPQARPGSRMHSAGPDWRTNPVTQIKWGLHYIKQRYGSPCHARDHSRATGWY